jgi:hypothetical protein
VLLAYQPRKVLNPEVKNGESGNVPHAFSDSILNRTGFPANQGVNVHMRFHSNLNAHDSARGLLSLLYHRVDDHFMCGQSVETGHAKSRSPLWLSYSFGSFTMLLILETRLDFSVQAFKMVQEGARDPLHRTECT